MKSSRIELFSPLSPAECLERLRQAMDMRRLRLPAFLAPDAKTVAGRIEGDCVRVWLKFYGRISFRAFFTGVLRAREGGTVIQGIFSLHPLVYAILLAWFGGVILLGGLFFVISLCGMLWGDPDKEAFRWLGLLLGPLLLIGGIGVTWYGCRHSRNEPELLEEFLRKTLGANDTATRGGVESWG